MGCFGYICRGCGKNIRGDCYIGGEKCVMIHIRNGVELGRVEGRYNEYGGVIEQSGLPEDQRYRGDGDGPNSHTEICKSEFDMPDSYLRTVEMRELDGKFVNIATFARKEALKDIVEAGYDPTKVSYYPDLLKAAKKWSTFDFLQESLNQLNQTIERPALTDADKKMKDSLILMSFPSLVEEVAQVEYIPDIQKKYEQLPHAQCDSWSGTIAYHKICYDKAVRDHTVSTVPSESDPDQSWGKPRKKFM
jgi:hypothetical protein